LVAHLTLIWQSHVGNWHTIAEQVLLLCWQTNYFYFSSLTNGQMTNFCLHDEQTANGSRKTWASLFHFPFDVSMSMSPCLCSHVSMCSSPCLHVSIYVSKFPEFANRKWNSQKMATSVRLLLMENGNGKLSLVCCKWKRKMEVCFPWLANNKC
jgi:hypothetical protein